METLTVSRRISELGSHLAGRIMENWSAPQGPSLPPLLRGALQLAVPCYLQALARDQQRRRRLRRKLPAFVVSVGNLVVGGTGKTPFTLWLAEHLTEHGFRVAVLSRGYGGSINEVAQVPGTGDTLPLARRFGDEPVLMARRLRNVPVWVGRNRYDAGLAAVRTSEARVLILDDGFQHLALARDLDLVLLDSRNPFGNGHVLPLGPLREPIKHLGRASAIILTRADDADRNEASRRLIRERFPDKPVFSCVHRLTGPAHGLGGPAIGFDRLSRAPAGAFAGIARPQSFFEALRHAGVHLKRHWAFPDHHLYTRHDLQAILDGVRRDGLHWLLTTEKDYVRLPSWFQSITLAVGITLDFGADTPLLRASILDAGLDLSLREM